MPKNVVTFVFTEGVNPYISDFGINYTVSSRFVAPPDLDDLAITGILTTIGATRTTSSAVCSDNVSLSPRKLQFIRASGNSVSIAIPERDNLIGNAQSIVGALNGSDNTNPVVCIKLIGEQSNNLNDEFGIAYDGNTFAPTHTAPSTSQKQNFVTGVIAYEADAAGTFGTSVLQPIRSITEAVDNTFAAQLGTIPADCGIDVLTVLNCPAGRRNPRDHRRFTLSFATKADPADAAEDALTETIELPVPRVGTLDVTACTTAMAALPGLYCAAYSGENYDRFHKLLP